jgi:hypothetical protein
MGNRVRISQREVLLQTNWRDIRLTGKSAASIRMSEKNNIEEFISALFGRLTRLPHKRFITTDLVLRRTRSSFKVQQLIKNFQISLSSRFELTLRKNKVFSKTDQYTQTKVLTMVHVNRAPNISLSLKTPKSDAESALEMLRTNEAVQPTGHPIDVESPRRTVRFAPVEMVMQQARSFSSPAEPKQQLERTHSLANLFKEESRNARAPIESINIKQLTDQVVEALDRRVIAAHERMARR